MPAELVKQLNDTLATVLTAPDLREKLSVEALEPHPMSPETFAEFMRADIVRWTQVAKARNIQLDN
jgi:tripartite-type tricarboxylate transporter receptor subunit TctC